MIRKSEDLPDKLGAIVRGTPIPVDLLDKKGISPDRTSLRFGDFVFLGDILQLKQLERRDMEKKRAEGSGMTARAIHIWIVVMLLIGAVSQAGAKTSVSGDIEKPVKQAIDTRQATQAAQEKWDGERSKLVALYDQLKAGNEQLTAARDRLSARADKLTSANRALEAEKAEAERIATEMQPHLLSVLEQINGLIQADAPFLHQERITRTAKLAAILEDPEITVAEKYRKTMEALFIEAEYGNTVEVYQEKIRLDDSEVLGNIFRLGRGVPVFPLPGPGQCRRV